MIKFKVCPSCGNDWDADCWEYLPETILEVEAWECPECWAVVAEGQFVTRPVSRKMHDDSEIVR